MRVGVRLGCLGQGSGASFACFRALFCVGCRALVFVLVVRLLSLVVFGCVVCVGLVACFVLVSACAVICLFVVSRYRSGVVMRQGGPWR